jgi:beta-galactosidase
VARADSNNGHVKNYELYLSDDGQNWGAPAAQGRIAKDAEEKTIQLAQPRKARYLKFVALSEQEGNPFASVAELEVVEAGNP